MNKLKNRIISDREFEKSNNYEYTINDLVEEDQQILYRLGGIRVYQIQALQANQYGPVSPLTGSQDGIELLGCDYLASTRNLMPLCYYIAATDEAIAQHELIIRELK